VSRRSARHLPRSAQPPTGAYGAPLARRSHTRQEVTASSSTTAGFCGKPRTPVDPPNLSSRRRQARVAGHPQTDRTLFFDFLPSSSARSAGCAPACRSTRSGAVFYESTRRMVLRAATRSCSSDSQAAMLDANARACEACARTAGERDHPSIRRSSSKQAGPARPAHLSLNAPLNPRNLPHFEPSPQRHGRRGDAQGHHQGAFHGSRNTTERPTRRRRRRRQSAHPRRRRRQRRRSR